MDPNTQDQQAPATEMPKEQNAVEEKHDCPCSREGHGNHGHHHCQNQGCCRRGIIKPTVISGNPSKQETRECPCAHHHDGENDHSHHHHDHHDGLGHDHGHPHDHSCEHGCEHQCECDHHGEQSSEQGHENGFPPDFLEFKHFRDVFPLLPSLTSRFNMPFSIILSICSASGRDEPTLTPFSLPTKRNTSKMTISCTNWTFSEIASLKTPSSYGMLWPHPVDTLVLLPWMKTTTQKCSDFLQESALSWGIFMNPFNEFSSDYDQMSKVESTLHQFVRDWSKEVCFSLGPWGRL